MANGIALSPDGKELWITEFSRNLLHRVALASATAIAPIGTGSPVSFHRPGTGFDARGQRRQPVCRDIRSRSCSGVEQERDTDRSSAFAGRDDGHNSQSTSMALKPDTNELYIVTNDGNGGEGATIFHAKVFAHGLPVH